MGHNWYVTLFSFTYSLYILQTHNEGKYVEIDAKIKIEVLQNIQTLICPNGTWKKQPVEI